MGTNVDLEAMCAAWASGEKIYASKRRCAQCGDGTRRYLSNSACIECARQRRHVVSTAKARRALGMRPTKAALRLQQRIELQAADRLAREAAAGRLTYTSPRPCEVRGHSPAIRYVSSGGCVACQKLAAAKRYQKRRKIDTES